MIVSVNELRSFLTQEFPQTRCELLSVEETGVTMRYPIGLEQLRPGGTVSGPVMMELVDVALYVTILSCIGIVPLTVTTQLSINFLRKPNGNANLLAECQLLKLGKSLATGEVRIYSEGSTDMVAHGVGTYSIPNQGRS